ncbi:hypothetical protein Tco_0532746 [Tanacetum coccineum]
MAMGSVPSVRMSPAPDPSRHEDPSIKRVYGSGVSSSTGILDCADCFSGRVEFFKVLKKSNDFSADLDKNLSRLASFSLRLYTSFSVLGDCFGRFPRCLEGFPVPFESQLWGYPSRMFRRCSAMDLGMLVMSADLQANMSRMDFSDKLPDNFYILGECAIFNFNHGSTFCKISMLHVPPENNKFEGEIIPCCDFRLGTSQPCA